MLISASTQRLEFILNLTSIHIKPYVYLLRLNYFFSKGSTRQYDVCIRKGHKETPDSKPHELRKMFSFVWIEQNTISAVKIDEVTAETTTPSFKSSFIILHTQMHKTKSLINFCHKIQISLTLPIYCSTISHKYSKPPVLYSHR